MEDLDDIKGALGETENLKYTPNGPKKQTGPEDIRPKPLTPACEGEWVEVARAWHGLEHQSIMAQKQIHVRNGKTYIEEYRLNGVYFDNFKDGILYDYKEYMPQFIDPNTGHFYEWWKGIDEALEKAPKQIKAANGAPVVWQVGKEQVEAYNRIIGDFKGVEVIP